ncbi:hypothetical protein BgiMline_014774, partial [Biomphalaria glabrata]
ISVLNYFVHQVTRKNLSKRGHYTKTLSSHKKGWLPGHEVDSLQLSRNIQNMSNIRQEYQVQCT